MIPLPSARIFTFSAGVAIAAFFSFTTAEAETDLKIGFIGGFSGPGKAYGEACKNGFVMGLDAAKSLKLHVIYEDDEFAPAKTVTAFKKLSEIDNIDLAIVLASSPSKAIAPIAEQKKIPLIAWASDEAVAKDRNYVFRSWVSGDAEGARLAAEVAKRKYPSIGFLVTTSDYNRSVRDGVKQHVPQSILLVDEEYAGDSRDFKPFLLTLKKRNIGHLGICLQPGQPGILAKQAKDLGLSLKIFGCESLHDKNELTLSHGTLEGSWFVSGAVSDEFHSAYSKRFGNEDVIDGAALHYDIAMLLAKIAAQAESPKQLIELLRTAKVESGAAGSFEVITEKGDQYFNINLVLKEIRKDGFHTLPD